MDAYGHGVSRDGSNYSEIECDPSSREHYTTSFRKKAPALPYHPNLDVDCMSRDPNNYSEIECDPLSGEPYNTTSFGGNVPAFANYSCIDMNGDSTFSHDANNYCEVEMPLGNHYDITTFDKSLQIPTAERFVPDPYSPLEFSTASSVYNVVDHTGSKKKKSKADHFGGLSIPAEGTSYSQVQPSLQQYEETSHVQELKKKKKAKKQSSSR